MTIKRLIPIFGLAAAGLFGACIKSTTPKTIYDTVTVTKTDTLVLAPPNDTLSLADGLLLYLPFNGSIADSSGNANPTQSVGSVLTYDAHGYANSAFGATGNGERVYVTNNGSIKFDTAYTLSFGFMVNSNARQVYISMVDPVNALGPTFLVGADLQTSSVMNDGTDDVSRGCSIGGGNDSVDVVDTTAFTPVPGSWYNAIIIYHRGTIQSYINGTLISAKVGHGTQAQLCQASQIVIGAWWDGDPLSMNGKLDNVRLYNRVLTPREIAILSGYYQINSNSMKPSLQRR